MKKLQLNKETIACLNKNAMGQCKGGYERYLTLLTVDTHCQTCVDATCMGPHCESKGCPPEFDGTILIPCLDGTVEATQVNEIDCITYTYINCFEQ